jgi:glycosyltransferase involved in cell wall biosynthesis
MTPHISGPQPIAPDFAAAEERSPAAAEPRRRMLYLYPDTLGLSSDPQKNPLHYLSRYLEGDYLAVWIVEDRITAQQRAREMAAANGRFRFHWTRRDWLPGPFRRLWQLVFFVGRGLILTLQHGRYDVIMVYGPFSTALAGLLLRTLTRSRLIVEFPGHPFRNYDMYAGWLPRLKRLIAPAWTRFVAARADHVRLLFPWQIDDLNVDVSGKVSVFHNFTTVSARRNDVQTLVAREESKYILFLGFPFHLKGVDVLIKAFNQISDRFPEYRLMIVGHCPDPSIYQAMTEGNPRIEIRRAVPHDEAMALLTGCTVFALASRIEGMARVLIEAMGAGKPVVSSAVGGIPHYITHAHNGLLFEPENAHDLAAQLTRLLDDPAFAQDLGRRGQEYASTYLSEEQYAARFRQMVDRVVQSY